MRGKDSVWMGLITQVFLPGQVDTVSEVKASNIFCFSDGPIKCARSFHIRSPQSCWVLFKGIESKPKIPKVQFPVPDHTAPENEAALEQLSPPMNLQFGFDSGACGNCHHTPYSARCCSQTPESGC